MKIAMVGAHRTGKTFLAELLASAMGFGFSRTSTSKVFQELGVDPSQPMDFATRMRCQHACISRYNQDLDAATGDCVLDRSPMCYSAYTLTDALEMKLSPAQIIEVAQYNVLCLSTVWQRRFDAFVIVHPHPDVPWGEEQWKGRRGDEYLHDLDTMMTGLTFNQGLYARIIEIPRTLALADRLTYVQERLA